MADSGTGTTTKCTAEYDAAVRGVSRERQRGKQSGNAQRMFELHAGVPFMSDLW
jgi:hypothetical protein